MWGEQWGKFQLTQFDSYTKKSLSKDRLEFMLGDKIDILEEKKVLEVGSGAGRFTELLADNAKELYTLDASEAIDYNKKIIQNSATHTLYKLIFLIFLLKIILSIMLFA